MNVGDEVTLGPKVGGSKATQAFSPGDKGKVVELVGEKHVRVEVPGKGTVKILRSWVALPW